MEELSQIDLWLPALAVVAALLWGGLWFWQMDAPPDKRRGVAFCRDVFFLSVAVGALRALFWFFPNMQPDHLFFGVVLLSAALWAGYAALLRAKILKNKKLGNFWRDMFFCFLFVFLLRGFFWDYFRIPSGSMLPNLYIGDVVLVDKNAYGYRLPLLGTRLGGGGLPARGDVAVFRDPEEGIFFIKRIIGLPGDVVRYGADKVVTINGEALPQSPAPPAGWPGLSAKLETIPQRGAHTLLLSGTPPFFVGAPRGCELLRGAEGDSLTCTVPSDQYFVLGDNRDRSNDSRFWGFVPRGELVGPAKVILFNYGNFGRFWQSLAPQ